MRVRLISILLLLVGLAAASPATVFDYTAEPDSGDTFTTAQFRVYLPDLAEVIRGVYFYVNPYNSDSRYIVDNSSFRELCDSVDFSLMGARLDNVHMESGIGEAVLEALTAFAGLSGHPEFAFTTLFYDGWSWGGQFSYHFAVWNPERVLGFVTQKGGFHDTGPAGDAALVPGYMFIGENDLGYRIKNLTDIFETHRPMGARWILAMQPDGGHGRITDRKLLDGYFETVTHLRLPETIPLDEPVELNIIDESSSWLGDRTSFEIGAFDCYDEEIGEACWCPSRVVSAGWQSFVSSGTVTDTIPCVPVRIHAPQTSPSTMVSMSPGRPNPFSPSTTATFHVRSGGWVHVEVYCMDGRRIRTLIDAPRAGGTYTVQWDGTADDGRTVAAGVYVCRLSVRGESVNQKMVFLDE